MTQEELNAALYRTAGWGDVATAAFHVSHGADVKSPWLDGSHDPTISFLPSLHRAFLSPGAMRGHRQGKAFVVSCFTKGAVYRLDHSAIRHSAPTGQERAPVRGS